MTSIAHENARKLETIKAAGNSYMVRKYAGAWIPVIVIAGTRKTFAHCSTSAGAMETAITKCAEASGYKA